MFCPTCGKENADGASYCNRCGANFSEMSMASPSHSPSRTSQNPMTFGESITTCLAKYADFDGRASRSEYWWFYLFTVLVNWGALIIDPFGVLYAVLNLAFLLPTLSAAVRRLHDTNKSGWWMLISLTLIGLIPLILWLASESDDRTNDYGGPA